MAKFKSLKEEREKKGITTPPNPASQSTFQIGSKLLSQEEYNTAKAQLGFDTTGQKTGEVNANVQAAVDASKAKDLEILAQRQLQPEIQQQAINEETIKQAGLPESQPFPTVDELKNPQTQTEQAPKGNKITDVAFGLPKDEEGFILDRNTGQRALDDEGKPIKLASGVAPFALASPAAILAGNRIMSLLKESDKAGKIFKSGLGVAVAGLGFLSLKKPLRASVAEQTFDDVQALIQNDIERVRKGELTAGEVRTNFERAAAQISKLESVQKREGKLSLRYFIDNGAEIQEKILTLNNELNNMRLDLLTAEQEGRLNRAKQELIKR